MLIWHLANSACSESWQQRPSQLQSGAVLPAEDIHGRKSSCHAEAKKQAAGPEAASDHLPLPAPSSQSRAFGLL